MEFIKAQEDMRKSYFGGGPGAFASGLVWLTAGIIALFSTKQISVLVFFFLGTRRSVKSSKSQHFISPSFSYTVFEILSNLGENIYLIQGNIFV